MRLGRGAASLAVAIGLAALVGCGAQPGVSETPDPTASAELSGTELSGTLTVFAAASLTETFEALAEKFEQQHPSVEVVLNFGGSSGLAQQIVAGAPADVFAAASEATMQTVVEEGLATDPVVFATNTLELVVPAGNPGDVTGLSDLARPELAIALCDPVVPCGAATEKLFTGEGIIAVPDTLEEDVRAVVTKVLLGEADAGLVYVTDVRAAGDGALGITIAAADRAVNLYPVSSIEGSASPALADAWIAMLTGPVGRAALAEAGFGAP